jgi:hypothetical protein
MNLADPEQFKRRYLEIEARAESGQESWRSAMARVASLAIRHGIELAREAIEDDLALPWNQSAPEGNQNERI